MWDKLICDTMIDGAAVLIFDGEYLGFHLAARTWIKQEIDELNFLMVVKPRSDLSIFLDKNGIVAKSYQLTIVQFANPQDAVLFRLAV